VFGFVQMMRKLVADEKPDALAIVFDPHGKTFRDGLYADYKATRAETPQDLVAQFGPIREYVEASGAALVEAEGFEADDAIATLARRGEAAGMEVVIASGDKDLAQVVSEKIALLDTMKGRKSGPAEVKEKWGVGPERITDLLAMMGDAVDNVPGIPGVGEKTAAALAQAGTLEELIADPEKSGKPRLAKLLREHAESALLSKQLVTLRFDAPVPPLEALAPREADSEKLRDLYGRMGFGRLLRELPHGPAPAAETAQTVLAAAELAALAPALANGFGLHLTTGPGGGMHAALAGVALSPPGAYVAVGHAPMLSPKQVRPAELAAVLGPLLADPAVPKWAHDGKRAILVLSRLGIELRGLAGDSMLSQYVLDPTAKNLLSAVSQEALGAAVLPPAGAGDADPAAVASPAAACARAAREACAALAPRIESAGLSPLLRDIDMPMLEVLARMERTGVLVDTAYLAGLSSEFEKRLVEVQKAIFEAAGESFNIDSTKQLQRVLFEKLKLAAGRRTKTGYSTDAAELERLASEHPVPAKIVEHRMLSKLKSTYVDALPLCVHPATGRIHTTFDQAVAATGRLSSNDPNLQNIPIRTEEGRRIRRAFVTSPGWKLLSADYSQIELRLLAHVSGDPALVDAFRHGRDVHARTAAEVFGVAEDAVTSDQRRHAKVVNFGIVYGMSAHGLAQSLGIDRATAARYIDAYFRRYAGVRAWLDRTLEETRRDGFVRTLHGRRRPLPGIRSSDPASRAAAERMAVNAPLQGSAADLIKVAMIRLDRALAERGMQARMLLQVHDELLFEAPEAELESLDRLARETMEGAMALDVPLLVETCRGAHWSELE
jgi:DNA polymerase-1